MLSKEGKVIDVDDTDGMNPLGEFGAWWLGELAQFKHDKPRLPLSRNARTLSENEDGLRSNERRRALKTSREEKPGFPAKRCFPPSIRQVYRPPSLARMLMKRSLDQETHKRFDFTETTGCRLLSTVMHIMNFVKRVGMSTHPPTRPRYYSLELAVAQVFSKQGPRVRIVRGASSVVVCR